MKDKKIIIAGGTGFIGQSLVKYLGRENEIVILGRFGSDHVSNSYGQKILTEKDNYRVRYVKWDGKTLDERWLREIDGCDILINLAGKSVNCRYHEKQMREIFDSRTHATRVLGEAVRKAVKPPSLWINASSTTIYKHRYDAPNDEFTGIISEAKRDNMPYNIIDGLRYWKDKHIMKKADADKDFSVQVVKRWEKVFFEQETPGARKIALRMAIALGVGGVITPYLNLCKLGMGGKHGHGRQMFSWVHEEDIARMVQWLYEKNDATGVYNCVAPNAISNKDLMKTMRKITGHKFGLPSPVAMLELGAFMIRTETELMLKSRWVYPARALREGFTFKYEFASDAITQIVKNLPRKAYHLF
jgi:uncharacterized protein